MKPMSPASRLLGYAMLCVLVPITIFLFGGTIYVLLLGEFYAAFGGAVFSLLFGAYCVAEYKRLKRAEVGAENGDERLK